MESFRSDNSIPFEIRQLLNEKGEEVGKQALSDYFSPPMSQRISHARRLLMNILDDCDPKVLDVLEELSEDESEIGYWSNLKKFNFHGCIYFAHEPKICTGLLF